MAVSKGGRHYTMRKRRGKKRTAELSARLAPLEEMQEAEKAKQAQPNGDRPPDDTILVDSKTVKLPERLTEEGREGSDIFRLHPVVVVILLVMLAFIAFVAWQITRMPPPAG